METRGKKNICPLIGRAEIYCYSIYSITGSAPMGVTLKFSGYIGEADFFGVKILNFGIFGGIQNK